MTSYERVLEAVAHRSPDRTPLDWFCIQSVADALRDRLGLATEEDLLAELGVDIARVEPRVTKRQPIPDHVRATHADAGTLGVTDHGAVLVSSERFPQAHRVWGPFHDTEDLDSFDWPGAEDIESAEAVRPEVDRLNGLGLCTMVRSENPFKIGYFMRPFDDFLMDCVSREDYAIELMSRVTDMEIARAESAVRAGARAAMMGGDFAHQTALMTSPATFRRTLKPMLARFTEAMRALDPEILLFLHSDGDLSDVLDDLVECGFQAVHPLQPECMDNVAIKRRYGDRLTLMGGMSVQTELPDSEPEAIRALVRRRIGELGGGGGFIMAPTNTILEDVPLASIEAMYRETQAVTPDP